MALVRHSSVRHGTNVLPFVLSARPPKQPDPCLSLAETLELYCERFPTKSGMLMLLDTWLFVAERDGVAVRQPLYVDALERAISALHATLTVGHAIALLRLQEARLARS
jgi:hypothetical protein